MSFSLPNLAAKASSLAAFDANKAIAGAGSALAAQALGAATTQFGGLGAAAGALKGLVPTDVGSPGGVASLAVPTFVTGAKEALAVVDVYDVKSSGIVNSYQDAKQSGLDLLGSISNTLKGLNLSAILSAASGGLKMAATVARGYAQLKAGQASGIIGGVSTIGSGIGFGQVGSLAQQASRISSIVNYGNGSSISRALAIGGIAMGGDGAALTKLASSYSVAERQAASLQKALKADNLAFALDVGSSFAGAAARLLSDLDPDCQQAFRLGAGSVFGYPGYGNNIYQIGCANAITSSMFDLTGGNYTTTVQDRNGLAGMISGLSMVGSKVGLNDVFGSFAKNGTDKQVMLTAARPLMAQAATVGDANLFNSVADAPEVRGELSTYMPALTRQMAANVLPTETLQQQDYSTFYDKLSKNLTSVDPRWNTTTHNGKEVLSSAYTAKNDFMTDLFAAKLNSQTGHLTQLVQSVQNSDAGQVTKVTVNNEAYLMMGSRFKDVSASGSLKEQYPEFYRTLSQDPMEIFA